MSSLLAQPQNSLSRLLPFLRTPPSHQPWRGQPLPLQMIGQELLSSLLFLGAAVTQREGVTSSWEHGKTQPSGGFSIRQDSLKVTSVLSWGQKTLVLCELPGKPPSHPIPPMLCGPQGWDLGSHVRRPTVAVHLDHVLPYSCIISVLMLCPKAL